MKSSAEPIQGLPKSGPKFHLVQQVFYWPENISTIFPQVHYETKKIFRTDHEISSDFSDELNERRFWERKGKFMQRS